MSSPDTDVLVLCVHHRPSIPAKELYFHTGHSGKLTSKTHFIPVHDLHATLTPSHRQVLLPIYCLTGCDTVSFLYGHGKGQAFRLMMNHSERYQGMAGLGTGDAITYSQTQACTKFISNMYGKESTSLTALRRERAGDIKKYVTAKKLPPTDDAFCLHLQRVSYQLKVWRQACQAIQVLPSLFNYGYQRQAYSI